MNFKEFHISFDYFIKIISFGIDFSKLILWLKYIIHFCFANYRRIYRYWGDIDYDGCPV